VAQAIVGTWSVSAICVHVTFIFRFLGTFIGVWQNNKIMQTFKVSVRLTFI
jgi:hypothetical protein